MFRPQLYRVHPGSHGTLPLHRNFGLPALRRLDRQGSGQVRQDLQSDARQNAPSISPLLQPPPTADSHQELPRHQAGQMGHHELHSRRRNLHRPGQGPTTGPSLDQPTVFSAVSWRTRRSPTRTTCCSWTAFTTPLHSSTC